MTIILLSNNYYLPPKNYLSNTSIRRLTACDSREGVIENRLAVMNNLITILILTFGIVTHSSELPVKGSKPRGGIPFKDGKVHFISEQRFMYVPNSSFLDTVYGNVTMLNDNDVFIESHYQEKYISDVNYHFTQSSKSDSTFVIFNNYDKDYVIFFVGIELMVDKSNVSLNGFDEQYRKIPKENLQSFRVTILSDIKSELINIEEEIFGDTLLIEFDYLPVRDTHRYTFISDTLKNHGKRIKHH